MTSASHRDLFTRVCPFREPGKAKPSSSPSSRTGRDYKKCTSRSVLLRPFYCNCFSLLLLPLGIGEGQSEFIFPEIAVFLQLRAISTRWPSWEMAWPEVSSQLNDLKKCETDSTDLIVGVRVSHFSRKFSFQLKPCNLQSYAIKNSMCPTLSKNPARSLGIRLVSEILVLVQ